MATQAENPRGLSLPPFLGTVFPRNQSRLVREKRMGQSLPTVPQRIITTTGEEQPAHEAWEQLVQEVLEYLCSTLGNVPLHDERRRGTLCIERGTSLQVSDDAVSMLVVRDRIVAVMVQRRTDLNLVETVYNLHLDGERLARPAAS